MNNTTQYSTDKTARTSRVIAKQRAENLCLLNINSVLELCVGPSASILEEEYTKNHISSYFNDIDSRWKEYSPRVPWKIGDCFKINWGQRAIVFAPPLSKGCSGKRQDSLMIDEVTPRYLDFITTFQYRSGDWRNKNRPQVGVLVLPGRSLSTKEDRKQFYKLLHKISVFNLNYEIVEMYDKVRKYVDIYITRR